MTVDSALHALIHGAVSDPWPYYARLREAGTGVHWSPQVRGWLVFRHDLIARMGRDSQTFSSDHFWDTAPGIHDRDREHHRRFVDVSARQFMFKDPPQHTRLRRILQPTFTATATREWEATVESAARRLLDRFEPGQPVEFMTEIAAEVPVIVIGSILGVPVDSQHDRARVRHWSQALTATFDRGALHDDRDRAIRSCNELIAYLGTLLEARRADPRDDLITTVAHSADGSPLDDRDLVAQLMLLLAAGNDTTVNLLGNGLNLLLDRPSLAADLTRRPGRMATALEEILRYEPPIHLDARVTTRDTVLGGTELRAGQDVFQVLGAANRDPRVFTDPDTFDIDRDNARNHLSFNPGRHHCIGAPLARAEGEVILRQLLRRFPAVRRDGDPVRRSHAIATRGLASLPVRL